LPIVETIRSNETTQLKKECEIYNTGDYFFTNNTQHPLLITINEKGTTLSKGINLELGLTQFYYNLKAQGYEYIILQLEFVSGDRNHNDTKLERH
jgi:hypothetical protein